MFGWGYRPWPTLGQEFTWRDEVKLKWPEVENRSPYKKGKVRLGRGHEGPQGEWRYSSTLSSNSALYEGEWLTPRPSRFTPAKANRYRRLGGPEGQCEQDRKISPPPGVDPQTVQPVTSRYTDWVTPLHLVAHNLLHNRSKCWSAQHQSRHCVPKLKQVRPHQLVEYGSRKKLTLQRNYNWMETHTTCIQWKILLLLFHVHHYTQ